jgi:hypothetical protein
MYNSGTGYKKIKTEIGNLMREYGFAPYKTATYYRVTAGDILQFINFQKGERSLNEQMTINIVIQGLFAPGCSFEILQPGGRIGRLLDSDKDVWWHCDTELMTAQSIRDIGKVVAEILVPFFDRMATADGLYMSFSEPASRFLWAIASSFVQKGYVCLKAGQYKKGISIFEENRPSQVAKFKTIKKLTEEARFEEIDSILLDNIRYHREKLKI